ncbi:MAG: hypothetical protein JXB23_05005, partial [Candidatus Aminicenantes bacterium]|nr:hypothetical protein [Candidatus Aminicenantes bacterium]
MSILKKAVLIAALLLIGLIDIFIYWNYHLYFRASKTGDPVEKAALLEKSNTYFPWNDLVFYELGKSYFDLGMERLDDPAAGGASLGKSVRSLKKSLWINPASPFAHLQLAQTLVNSELISLESGPAADEEFRKAAQLAGEDSQVFHEVGRIFLARWPALSDKDRDFTLDMLRKTLAKKDKERVELILSTWELNAGDYRIMDEVLPEDARVYRQYAEFLGEKSLSLEERHKYLARAEALEFAAAKELSRAGEIELSDSWYEEAYSQFRRALNSLRNIKFYHILAEEEFIVEEEFREFRKSLFLNLAKCRIEKGKSLDEWIGHLEQYLDAEDEGGRIDALERYLVDRRVIPPRSENTFDDIDRLAFELLLLEKRNKYSAVIDFGRALEGSFVVIPEDKKKSYARILQIVGNSLQKTGRLFDARDFYEKAAQIEPESLDILLGLRYCHERLNDDTKLLAVNAEIEKLLTPKNLDL